MIAEKGMIMEMEGQRFVVDDIHNINGIDYIVFYAVDTVSFHIATEEVVDGAPEYHFLDKKEAIKIAEEIDKL